MDDGSDYTPIIIGVIASIAGIIICITIYSCYRRKKNGLPIFMGPNSGRAALEAQYRQQLAQREARLKEEVERRRLEEEDETKGSQVWFSRYIHNGRLRHWVLVIDDVKYELRRDDTKGEYVHNVQPWTLDREQREAALAERLIPNVDGYYVCLIGWTRLPSEQLREIAAEVMAGFGIYFMLWNNCQTFLKDFADRIISNKALDWDWFRDNTKTEYQNEQKLPPTPEEIIARQNAAMANQQAQLHRHNQNHMHNMHNMHHMQHQTHQNVQNQQLQNQILQNIQMNQLVLNQVMQTQSAGIMANNPAMNPGMNPGMSGMGPGMGGGGA